MSYLIDSDWVIDALKGRLAARNLFQTLAPGPFAISMMTYGEVFEGIYFGRDPQESQKVFSRFLRGVTVLPLNQSVMRQFAMVRGTLRATGQIIGDPDILIAATALHYQLTLVTHNKQHFQRILGLQLY